MNKLWLWGGAGAVALIAGAMLLRGGGGGSASSGDSGLGAYYPATVYGGGSYGSGAVATDNSGSSTDNSIAQLIAGNLAIAQEQSTTTRYTSDNEKAIALAGYGSQQTIAANDNATKLALAQNNNQTEIQKSLAAQLGALASGFGSKSGVIGNIGFDGSKINVDLKAVPTAARR